MFEVKMCCFANDFQYRFTLISVDVLFMKRSMSGLILEKNVVNMNNF